MIFIRKIIVSGYLLIALLLLAISYIIMHRNANCIKRYKKETTDRATETFCGTKRVTDCFPQESGACHSP